MKTKKEFLANILNKLEHHKLNPEEVQKIEFLGEKEIIEGKGWVLVNNTLLFTDFQITPAMKAEIEKVKPLAEKYLKK